MPPVPVAQIIDNRRAVQIDWPDGKRLRYHSVWLRDNGQDTLTRDPVSGQKKFAVADLDLDLEILRTHFENTRLEIAFSDGSETWLDLRWLEAANYDTPSPFCLIPSHATTWDRDLDPEAVTDKFTEIRNSAAALVRWLEYVQTYGFARLSGVPEQPGALFDVIGLFGFVRETNYGRLFEVRSEAKPVNLAFTREGLDPHTDNPYRDPVPTLQILHCIENDSEGGESLVVDGYRCAEILRHESPEHFDLLSQYSVNFEFWGDGVSHLHASRPQIELSPEGELLAVRVNNRSSAALTNIPYEKIPSFYAAQAHLTEITRRPGLAVQFKLTPGELFMVDNTRVLHGRREYSETGSRWFQGAYADIDSLHSKIRIHKEKSYVRDEQDTING